MLVSTIASSLNSQQSPKEYFQLYQSSLDPILAPEQRIACEALRQILLKGRRQTIIHIVYREVALLLCSCDNRSYWRRSYSISALIIGSNCNACSISTLFWWNKTVRYSITYFCKGDFNLSKHLFKEITTGKIWLISCCLERVLRIYKASNTR